MRVWPSGHARRAPRHAAFAAVFALLASSPAAAARGAPPLRAHVAWAGAGHIYVVAADSLSPAEGARLLFAQHGRTLSGARIESVLGGHLIVAADSANLVASLARPERLQVFLVAGRSATARSLRVGIPADARGNPLVRCEATHPAPPASAGYREEKLTPLETRLVRTGADAPWPDTLRVIRFADSADEEIALERGEIEIGVFWPGELSSAMRQSPAWRDFALGRSAAGGLSVTDASAAIPAAEAAALAGPAMAALNRDVFRGDLELTVAADSGAGSGVRFLVEDSVPGHAGLERALDSHSLPVVGAAHRTLRIAPAGPGAGGASGPGIVLRVRCAVVSAARWRDLVRQLGAEAFADLPGCAGAGAGP